MVKRGVPFSCGRISDIIGLKWGNVLLIMPRLVWRWRWQKTKEPITATSTRRVEDAEREEGGRRQIRPTCLQISPINWDRAEAVAGITVYFHCPVRHNIRDHDADARCDLTCIALAWHRRSKAVRHKNHQPEKHRSSQSLT